MIFNYLFLSFYKLCLQAVGSAKTEITFIKNKMCYFRCTYSFESSLNDDKNFSFKTKLIIMFIFRALQIYNLLLNIRYFLFCWRRNQIFTLKKCFYHSMNVQNCKYIYFRKKKAKSIFSSIKIESSTPP